MKRAFQIFSRDIQRLYHNRVAMIVMAGVCVLPSLYAWLNIAANMDPYSNTQGIKVAVANNDTGAEKDKISLNAGNDIVGNLRTNEKLGWTYVDEEKAVNGVRSGKYYAAIVIPSNFSSSLISIVSGIPKEAKLDYYINEKKNAIAPKITATGAGTIQQEINDTFSSVASETISKEIQASVLKVSGDMNNVNTEVMSTLSEIRSNLVQYQKLLKNFQSTVGDSFVLIDDTISTWKSVKTSANDGAAALSDISDSLHEGRNSIGEFSAAFSESLTQGDRALSDIYGTTVVRLSKLEGQAETVKGKIDRGAETIKSLIQINEEIQDDFNNLKDSDGNMPEGISNQIEQLTASLQNNKELLESLSSGGAGISDAIDVSGAAKEKLEALLSDSHQSLQSYRNDFDQTLLPQLNQSLDGLSSLSGSLSATLSGIPASVDQLEVILNQLKSGLTETQRIMINTGDALGDLSKKLEGMTTDLKALESSKAYQDFLSLGKLDADDVSEFMASPVEIQTETLYRVKDYGSSMTPFYTNLALWVGGIILIAILKLEVDRDEKVPKFSPTSAYFGRWMLYVTLGLMQGLIVCLGDLWILKAQCIHPVAFVLAGMFCSFIYINLIYALSGAFKHIGKALCVILVILQIPGSAGTYPIEMTPVFFRKLHPLLPFTYGINAMREAIAGMYGYNYAKNMLYLALFLPIAFIIGLGLRHLMANLNHLFDKKLSETDLMLCETDGIKRERPQLNLIIKALLGEKATREELAEKAAAFELKYPKRIRGGFTAILLLPIIFLILMFSIESKIVFLILWIASIILIAGYLIFIEYIHEQMNRQLALNDLSLEELLNEMKGERDE